MSSAMAVMMVAVIVIVIVIEAWLTGAEEAEAPWQEGTRNGD